MKITADRQELLEALTLAGSIVSTRNPRQELMSVAFEAKAGALELCSTDLEVSLRVRLRQADVEAPGSALLPAARILPIVKEFDGDKVELHVEDKVARVSSGGSRFTIVSEDASVFPEIPTFDGEGAIRFGRLHLEAMIRRTVFAAASEGTRYALNGVLFDLQPGRLRLVATDGKRLAMAERQVELPDGKPVHVVVPTKGVQALGKLGLPDEETLELRFNERQLLARSSRAVLAAQLVEGHFPPYDSVIPKGHPVTVELEAARFLPALRRASLLTDKDSRAVRLSFTFEKLTLSSRTPDIGESTVEIPVAYGGDPIAVGFDPVYLMDGVRAVESERFSLELKSEAAPGVLREGTDFTYVVMPISLV